MNGGRRRECHFPSTVVSRAIPVFRPTEFALTEPLPNRSGLGFLIPPPASAILPAATRPHHPFLPSAGITPSTSPFSSHLSVTPGNRRRCNTSSLTTIQQPFQSRPWADADTMSNSHQLRPYISVGEIDHVHILSEHLGGLIQGEEYSDVTFLVEKRRFPAHRVILAARCQYFRALLYGGMRESHSQAEIPLPDTPADAFTMLLKYIYTGQVTLSNVKEEVLLDFLSLAHKYGFPELEAAASEYLCTILSISNVCMVYDVANLYSLTKLENTCCLYIDRNAKAVLGSEGFLTLSKNALLKVVSRDSFAAPEKEIFLALMNWCKQNPGEMYADIMKMVRLPLMSLTELLNVVRPSSLLSADTILDAIKVRSESRDMELNYRGVLIPDENIASMKHGAQVIGGELKAALLDGDSQNYDLDHGFSRHPIDEDCRSAIEVKLGQASIVNHIRMLLWDRDSRSYSYYVEVSMDELDWIRIIDHSKYLCRSWQNLFFTPRVCRYIRIVGTHNTVNKVFHLVSFECMYSSKHFLLDAGMLENVATVGASAAVIEGVSRSRNALLNGDTKNYDWDSGYTCHQLGSGAIVIQLAQPFVISSMRLLLWDCDDRSYSFYVEVSNDQQQWRMVADHTKITCKSWQTIIIEQQPVVFIRIVGTHNTANEVFHCVHFECPAQNQVQQQCEAWLGGRAEAGSRASPGLLSQGTLSGARPESRR